MPPLLAVRGLSLRYPDGKRALSDVDLEVRAGALTVVLGGNGCGKTTLLRCINRALMPTAGEVWLDGSELTRLTGEALRRARLDIAMIWQQANLIRRRPVAANVAAGALGRHQTLWTALGGLPAEAMRAAHAHLGGVGLAHLAGQRAGTLSGGQAQRVAIARALAQRPRLLLADEPVASLDPEAADGIMRLLRQLAHRDGLAVMCVLHQVDLAFDYADRVVGMRGGRTVFDAPPVRCRAPRCANSIWPTGMSGEFLSALPLRSWAGAAGIALRSVVVVLGLAIVVQSLIVVQARPRDLITGVHGMADIIGRAMPPDFSRFPDMLWPALETIDIAIFGTVAGVCMAVPLAVLAAANVTPSRAVYFLSRGIIGVARSVPDLVGLCCS